MSYNTKHIVNIYIQIVRHRKVHFIIKGTYQEKASES